MWNYNLNITASFKNETVSKNYNSKDSRIFIVFSELPLESSHCCLLFSSIIYSCGTQLCCIVRQKCHQHNTQNSRNHFERNENDKKRKTCATLTCADLAYCHIWYWHKRWLMSTKNITEMPQLCLRCLYYRVCPPERTDKFIFDTVEYQTHHEIWFYKQSNRDFVLCLVFLGSLDVFHYCPKCLFFSLSNSCISFVFALGQQSSSTAYWRRQTGCVSILTPLSMFKLVWTHFILETCLKLSFKYGIGTQLESDTTQNVARAARSLYSTNNYRNGLTARVSSRQVRSDRPVRNSLPTCLLPSNQRHQRGGVSSDRFGLRGKCSPDCFTTISSVLVDL